MGQNIKEGRKTENMSGMRKEGGQRIGCGIGSDEERKKKEM